MSARRARSRRMGGVSLIEVLVSTVVLSVGALSATSLQLVTKRNNHEASQRLEATHLASTIIERMRANNSPTALRAYVATAAGTVGLGRLDAALQLDCSGGSACCMDAGATCTAAQIAAVELWQWEQVMDGRMETFDAGTANAGGLDRPTACISAPSPAGAGAPGFYTVTIAFRGTVAMTDGGAVTCGRQAAYADGTPLYGAHDEYRRTLTLAVYITPSVGK